MFLSTSDCFEINITYCDSIFGECIEFAYSLFLCLMLLYSTFLHCAFLSISDCFEITIPPGDHIFKECMEFVRSDPLTYDNGEVPQPRVHINAITAWMDASMVYGQ